ncbi:MAG: hypothetical protein QOG04_2027 [Actinomycetota bacterium]|jgi:hypothetical protein|nr:hypothetical protein [Actinomycetota bacterium]
MMNKQIDMTRSIPLLCAVIGVLMSGLAAGMFMTADGANVTSLIRMAPEDPIAPIAQEIEGGDFRFVPAGHYDGVYYYAIAIDPLAKGEAHQVIDLASHRYGHPGYGWLAWLGSLGHPGWVPQVLLLLSLVGIGVASYFASLISMHLGANPWGGLFVALNPGLIFSVTTDTSEAVTAALLAVGLYLWFHDRREPAAWLLAFLCFFKFQMLLVPIGLGLYELNEFRLGRRKHDLKTSLLILAIGPVAFLIWLRYVYAQFGDTPLGGGQDFLSLPFIGWIDTLHDLSALGPMSFEGVQLASAELPILVTLLALFTAGVVRSFRLRHPMDAVFLLQGFFVLLLNWWNLLYPKDLIRALAIPIPMLACVFFLRNRRQDQPAATDTLAT